MILAQDELACCAQGAQSASCGVPAAAGVQRPLGQLGAALHIGPAACWVGRTGQIAFKAAGVLAAESGNCGAAGAQRGFDLVVSRQQRDHGTGPAAYCGQGLDGVLRFPRAASVKAGAPTRRGVAVFTQSVCT